MAKDHNTDASFYICVILYKDVYKLLSLISFKLCFSFYSGFYHNFFLLFY